MSIVSLLVAGASQLAPKFSSRVLASSGYTLDPSKFGGRDVFSVWTESTAERQNRAWLPIVEAAKAGKPREDVAALYDALASLSDVPATVLEVGCGGGYNSEIIQSKYPALKYYGIDISVAMVDLARKHYPGRAFVAASAYAIPLADRSEDVVIDGVALIHMPNWQKALSEYVRVAKNYVILHGLTLTDSAPTTEFAKYAYGQPTLEFVFNRAELSESCENLGLRLSNKMGGLDYNLKRYIGIESVSETWVLSAHGTH
jgi:SAM-dependent methyltransferase